MKNKCTVIKRGLAVCYFEPRGYNGFEPYHLNTEYPYEFVGKGDNGHYRLYPTMKLDHKYYETCSTQTFNQCFKDKATCLKCLTDEPNKRCNDICCRHIDINGDVKCYSIGEIKDITNGEG